MNPEATYLQHLESIKRIAAFVARRAHLNADETDEFIQIVCVRLFENDYAIIRKFEGRSSFTTYLTTVILHLHHQERVTQWGKWRPSAEAKRLGDHAITLERLLTRDGFTFDEAVKILTTHAGSPYSLAELEAIYLRLPPRNPRPMMLPNDDLPEVAVEPEAHHNAEAHDRETAARRCAAVLDKEIAKFKAEDRTILQLRFWRGLKVPEIARILNLEQKKLYKRLEKLLLSLRRALEAAGVNSTDHEIHLDLPPDEEK
jgi:RNA polymerase sigma factor (sigma-70 family)